MKKKNGAHYEFYLPDEIEEKLANDPRWIREDSIRAKQKEASRKQFHEDHRIFYMNYDKGRFKNKLKGDPLCNNSVFAGSWNEGDEDYTGKYGFHTIIMNNVKLSYQRIYRRDHVDFRIYLDKPIDTYLNTFFSQYKGHYTLEDFDLRPNYSSPAMIAKSKGDLCDIEFFISFLVFLISI